MANGELNTSLKEVNDMIGKIDSNVNKLSSNWHKFLSEKPNLSALQAIVDQYKQLGDLQIELSKHSGSGSGTQRGNMKRLGENMVDNTEKIRAQLQKLGVDASTVGGTVGVSFATMASDITRAMQTIGKSVDLTQTSNDKLNTAAQKLAEEFRKAAEKAMSEKAVDASKIIKTGVGQVGTTEATRGFQKLHDADRLGLQPSEVNVEFVGAYQQAYAELLATQQKAIDKQREFDAEFSKGKQQTSAIAGVVENYDKWEQKLAQLEKEQMELNVKQEAGVISAREAANEQSRIIREQREAKKNLARINKTTEQAEREMMQKQASDIRRLNELWDENRRLVTRLKELNSKPANERTKSEQELLDEINKKLTTQEVELDNLQNKYRGVAEAEHVFAEQQMRDIENRIRAERDLAKQNAPKVSLGSTTGDVTTVSGAYRTQIKLYEEENRLLREQQAIRKELQNRSTTDADEKHLESIDKRLKQIKKDRESIANTQLFKSASDQAKLDYAAKQTGEIRRRTNEAMMATAAWARENARVATTYQQLKFAADNIRNVLQNTDLTKLEARQLVSELNKVEKKIQDCEKSMGTFKEQSRSLLDTVSQLAMGFGIMFSLQAVSQFARKIVEIRGEFELQEVALKAIVQDSLKGQQIWNETVQNALKSPFSVKQLVTYTKQLAAYRIETDKLTDTTKRLADISAGLGVDMQRLILAYGQVKAAAYLRASEVRQFTEAGINMYGELSKYFSEIEGRAVSTADVVERVSKRMVSFEDVAEVFKRLTDEGGTFYNMQEIQSETVRGQVMKLRDAYDIMLNNIGEKNEGVIKNITSFLLDITKHYEMLMPLLDGLLSYIIVYKAIVPLLGKINTVLGKVVLTTLQTESATRAVNTALGIQGYQIKSVEMNWKKFNATLTVVNANGMKRVFLLNKMETASLLLKNALKTLGVAFKSLGKAIKAAFMSNPIGLLLTAALTLIPIIDRFIEKQTRLNKLITETQNKLRDQITETTANFTNLADEAVGAGDIEKQTEALTKLKNAYGDMLPAYMLEIDYLASMGGQYDELTESIKRYLEQKALQQALEDNKNAYSNDINTDTADLVSATTGENIYNAAGEKIGEVTKGLATQMSKMFNDWLAEQAGEVTESEAVQQYAQIFKKLTNDARDYYDIMNMIRNDGFMDIGGMDKNIEELVESHNNIVNDEKQIKDSIASAGWLEVDFLGTVGNEANTVRTRIDQINKSTQTYISLQKKVIDLQKKKVRLDELEKKGEDRSTAEESEYVALKNYIENIDAIRQQLDADNKRDLSNALEATNANREALIAEYEDDMKALSKNIDMLREQASRGNKEAKNLIPTYLKAYQTLEESANKIRNDWTTVWNKKMEDSINKLKINDTIPAIQNYISSTTAELGKTPKEVGTKLRSSSEEIKNSIAQYRRLLAAEGEAVAQAATGLSKDMLAPLEALANLFDNKATELIGEKKKGHSQDPFQSRLSVIKEMYQEAKKLNKELYSADRSAKSVVEEYKKAFNTAFKGNKKADEIWDVVQRSLSGWGEKGGSINEAMIAGIQSYLDTIKDPKHRAELEKMLSNLKVEIEVDKSKESMDKFKKDIDGYFKDVELARELQKLHIPVDFYDLFDIKATTTDEIRDALEKEKISKGYDKIDKATWDEEFRKYYDDTMRKLDETDDKHLQDRMKKYMKYMTGEMSAMEKLYYEEQVALREIRETFLFNEADRLQELKDKGNEVTDEEIAEMNRLIERQEEVNKARKAAEDGVAREFETKRNQQVWKDFTSTDMYTSLFGDLDKVANTSLEELKRQLEGLKNSLGDLSPTEIRQINTQLEKIDEIQRKRKPIKSFVNDLSLLVKGGKKKAIEEQVAALKKLAQANKELDEAKKRRAALGSKNEYNSTQWQQLTEEITQAEQKQKEYQEEVDAATGKVNNFTRAQVNLGQQLQSTGSGLKSVASDAMSMYTNIMTMMGRADEANTEYMQGLMSMADTTADVLVNVGKIVASEGADIAAWIGAAAGTISLIAQAFGLGDAKLNDHITKLGRQIDNITRRVERFQKEMERAMNMTEYFTNYEQAMSSLSAKYDAIMEQYDAESAKKNPDSEVLEGYRQQMRDVEEEMRELKDKRTQEWGGIGESNWRASAEEFVDAWMQAFQETGDGLSGLQDNFDEFIKNLFKKQAAMRIANAMLKPVFEMIDRMTEDGTVTRGELDAVREKMGQVLPELNEALKGLLEELGVGMDATDTLSGLQQGIQGITEATAEVIEGYLNSIRFFIAEDNMMLRQIRDAVLSGTQSASYAILSRIDENVRRIWDKLSDITMPNQTANTMAVRIVS